jgi:N-acyl-L-homoserine lactone synthetase
MIELIQTGQAGQASFLTDMHRLRARVFKDMLQWDVHVDTDGLEIDNFDGPAAVYLLALDDERRVIGSWRLLSSTGPTMIRDVWPQYLESLPMPSTDEVWEVSRFAIIPSASTRLEKSRQTQTVIAEMFCALTETCIATGILDIYSLYNESFAKVLKRINCLPYKISASMPIDRVDYKTAGFRMDAEMLQKVQEATGIRQRLVSHFEFSPVLAALAARRAKSQ